VSIREADVTEIIRTHRSKFDAILLDVDNGPEGLTRKANDALYSSAGLQARTPRCGRAAFWPSGRPGPIRHSQSACTVQASTSTKSTSAPPAEAAAPATSSGSRRRIKPPSPPRDARARRSRR
jgi:hypothetical protein